MPRVVVLKTEDQTKLWLCQTAGSSEWEWTQALDDAAKFGTREEALEAVGEKYGIRIEPAPAPDVTMTMSAGQHRMLMSILDAAKDRHAKSKSRRALIEIIREAGEE